MTTIDALRIRAVLGRKTWTVPRPFGEDGWHLTRIDGGARVVVTVYSNEDDGTEWIHASMSHPDSDPTYAELQLLHRAVWGRGGWAYQVFAPAEAHVNLHDHALHLWGRQDGRPGITTEVPLVAGALGLV